MVHQIRKVAVIGSGVMGSGIAAHFANAGIQTLLFDVVPNELTNEEKKKGLTLKDKQVRNRHSERAVKKLLKQTPPPLASKERKAFIVPCNLEDDFERLEAVDWIIEAIIEKKEAKQQLFKQIDSIRKRHTIVSSNTSGISIHEMASDCSDDFKVHFLGTHFFNPPRYLKLLEIIPTEKTDKNIIKWLKDFAENALGKGVVIGKDTPNFIANRIGTYGLLVTAKEMLKGNYSVGEVDSVTGTLIGRPKSATFRTLDVVGLDTFLHVASNVYEKGDGTEKEVFAVPPFMQKMVENGWLGSKSGQGFYMKRKGGTGSQIFELNLNTFKYEERKKLKASSINKAKQEKDLTKRLTMMVEADDRAGRLVWNILKPVLLYSAEKMDEIASNLASLKRL